MMGKPDRQVPLWNYRVNLDKRCAMIILRTMLLLFLDDIKSERELMRLIPERLDYLWFLAGRQVAHAVFGYKGCRHQSLSLALFFPQDEHERLLIDRLAEVGVHVERRTELVNFKEASGCVQAHLKRSDGSLEICWTAYLAGCDGAHYTDREAQNIGFPGAHIPVKLLLLLAVMCGWVLVILGPIFILLVTFTVLHAIWELVRRKF